MSIPETQWAQVVEKKDTLVYKQIPVQKPGPDEVLVKIKYSGVCHTDLHAMKGDWPLASKLPLVGGHEGAGVVVAKGDLVKDIEIGDYAGIKWLNGSCLACEFCRRSEEPLCPHALLSGYTVDGTFQQYAVAKAAHVSKIPKNVPLDAVAPVLCAGITVYKGLKESGARPGETVAIVGAGGGLGSLAQQYAKAMGLRVIAIDGGDEKKALCEQLGAEAYVDFTKSKDLVKDVQAATPDGLGPHAVLLVAVAELPFQQASNYVRPRGTIVAIGLPANAYLKAPVFDTVVKMVTIKGSYVGNRQDGDEAIDFFARGLIKTPYKVVPLSELGKVYELMAAPADRLEAQDTGTAVSVIRIRAPWRRDEIAWGERNNANRPALAVRPAKGKNGKEAQAQLAHATNTASFHEAALALHHHPISRHVAPSAFSSPLSLFPSPSPILTTTFHPLLHPDIALSPRYCCIAAPSAAPPVPRHRVWSHPHTPPRGTGRPSLQVREDAKKNLQPATRPVLPSLLDLNRVLWQFVVLSEPD